MSAKIANRVYTKEILARSKKNHLPIYAFVDLYNPRFIEVDIDQYDIELYNNIISQFSIPERYLHVS